MNDTRKDEWMDSKAQTTGIVKTARQRLTRRRLLVSAATGTATLALTPLLAACGDENPTATSVPQSAPTSPPQTVAPTSTPQTVAGASTQAPAAATATPMPAAPTATAEPVDDPGDGPRARTQSDYDYAPQTGIERDTMIVGVQGLPATVDPAAELSNVGTRVSYTPYDTLIRRDFLNGHEHVPSLAVAWERVSDTVLELELREDVTFHNGDPFTAEDVKFTFDQLLEAATDSTLTEARTYFASVSSVEAIDDYTVRFTTHAPDPILVKRLASWASWIVPKGYIEQVGRDQFARIGMGTGPFRFVSFDPDNELVLERYDGYWGERPTLRQLVFRVIPEVAARVTALVNDEVQIITNIPPDQTSTIQNAQGVHVRDIGLANVHVLQYNTNHPHLTDKRLRQALNISIDRQLIIDTIWSGFAIPKRGHQFDEYGPLYNPDRPFIPYDPERARQLIAESDYAGETIQYQLAAGYYTNGEQVGQAIVQMWREVGLTVELQVNEQAIGAPDRQVHTWSNSSRLADPDGSIWLLWGEGSSVQRNFWSAPEEFNRIGIEARSTFDEALRYELYQQLLDIWEDEAPGTVLFDPVEFYGVSDKVNWSPYTFYYMDLRAYNLSFNE